MYSTPESVHEQVLEYLYDMAAMQTEPMDSDDLEQMLDDYSEKLCEENNIDDVWSNGLLGDQILRSVYSDPDNMVLCPECALYYETGESLTYLPNQFPIQNGSPLFRMMDYGCSTCDNCECRTNYFTVTIYSDLAHTNRACTL